MLFLSTLNIVPDQLINDLFEQREVWFWRLLGFYRSFKCDMNLMIWRERERCKERGGNVRREGGICREKEERERDKEGGRSHFCCL